MDWYTVIICLGIGFIIGRIYPLVKKTMAFIQKETNKTGDKKI